MLKAQLMEKNWTFIIFNKMVISHSRYILKDITYWLTQMSRYLFVELV